MLGGMRRPWWLAVPVLVLATVAGVPAARSTRAAVRDDLRREFDGAHFRLDGKQAGAVGAPVLSEDVRRATFRFDPSVAAADRQAFLSGVAAARPDARRLVDLVDGLVSVSVGATPDDVAGVTTATADRYVMTRQPGARVPRVRAQRGIDCSCCTSSARIASFPTRSRPLWTPASPRGGGARRGTWVAAPFTRSASRRASRNGPRATSASTSTSATRSRRRAPRSRAWGAPLAELARSAGS